MLIKNVTDFLEEKYPLSLQESYDNCGLTYGHKEQKLSGILFALDVTENTVKEAISKNCNLIISHHPVVFKGLKKINGSTMTERVLELSIKNNIALYAIHTNLDNHKNGVNKRIADKIGLSQLKILSPKNETLVKLCVFVPEDAEPTLSNALFKSGAGAIGNYSECNFKSIGKGSFKPNLNATPSVGAINKKIESTEVKVEYLVPLARLSIVLNAMNANHPYEEVAHDIIPLLNSQQDMGSGMIGELQEPMTTRSFLKHLKATFNVGIIKHTALIYDEINTVAICGGSGSFLIDAARKNKADIFITSDIKYHEFFDANNELIIADIGHWESEQFTVNLLYENIKEKFSKFALHLSEENTNPVKYF